MREPSQYPRVARPSKSAHFGRSCWSLNVVSQAPSEAMLPLVSARRDCLFWACSQRTNVDGKASLLLNRCSVSSLSLDVGQSLATLVHLEPSFTSSKVRPRVALLHSYAPSLIVVTRTGVASNVAGAAGDAWALVMQHQLHNSCPHHCSPTHESLAAVLHCPTTFETDVHINASSSNSEAVFQRYGGQGIVEEGGGLRGLS